ncbi:MAG: glycosyltransferase family protein [Magnetococcales bacterium]|nr:glycosyltransferase family protein [Magnetococcales bacterium]
MSDIPIPELIARATQALAKQEHVQVTALLRQVLESDPTHADAWYLLGVNANAMNHPELGRQLLAKAIAFQGDRPLYHFHHGSCLHTLGQLPEAEQAFRTAIALHPHQAEFHINLGNVRLDQGDSRAAIACYEEALRLNPDHKDAHHNLGVILQSMNAHEAALERFRAALRCNPDNATSHMGIAASLLKTGRFLEAWPEYEWRFRLANHSARICPVPRWDGSDPAGKRLYLYTEQGFGDALMFARFAQVLRERGATVLLECRPELLSLFTASELADLVTARDTEDKDPPPFEYDLHLPLMSLPLLLNTTLDTLPARVPYLHPPETRIAAWAEKLGPRHGLRVGLSWSGNPNATVNRERACILDHFLPLTEMPGVTFYALQKGPPAAQLTPEIQARHGIIPLEAQLTDFTETAALMRNLDLVISTDTAVVHLAGGLGVPVWTLLHTACEWRWLETRLDSPWYPTMRLFRQPAPGDWPGVIDQARRALVELR